MKLFLIPILFSLITATSAYSEELLYPTSDNIDVDNLNQMAWVEFLQSNFTDSVLLFDKALNIESDNTYALLHQGYGYTELEKYVDARDNFKKIFEKFPIHLTGFNAIGDTYLLENNFHEAQIWYTKTIHENPFETYALLKMADTQQEMGNYENSILEYDKVLSFEPSDPNIVVNAVLGMSISYYYLGDYSLAQQELPYVLEHGNTVQKIIAHVYNGLSLQQTGDLLAAQNEFDVAKSFDMESIVLQTEKNKVNNAKNLIPERTDSLNYANNLDLQSLLPFIVIIIIVILLAIVISLIYQSKKKI